MLRLESCLFLAAMLYKLQSAKDRDAQTNRKYQVVVISNRSAEKSADLVFFRVEFPVHASEGNISNSGSWLEKKAILPSWGAIRSRPLGTRVAEGGPGRQEIGEPGSPKR
jgi:hypothetical protein